jgi:hypothetical protein
MTNHPTLLAAMPAVKFSSTIIEKKDVKQPQQQQQHRHYKHQSTSFINVVNPGFQQFDRLFEKCERSLRIDCHTRLQHPQQGALCCCWRRRRQWQLRKMCKSMSVFLMLLWKAKITSLINALMIVPCKGCRLQSMP